MFQLQLLISNVDERNILITYDACKKQQYYVKRTSLIWTKN